jgi:sugar/nucleoside kinase (ribokinase family)
MLTAWYNEFMTKDIHIIAVGSASEDVYLSGSAIAAVCNPVTNECVEQFPLGAKIEVERMVYGTGGGATNAAVTFSRQGLHASFAGKIGKDPAGEEIIRVLTEEKVSTEHVSYDDTIGTQFSTILLNETGERTILIYRGASHNHKVEDYDAATMHADWMYISSLAGAMDVLEHLVNHAHHMGIKVALNAGEAELKQKDRLQALLPKLTVFAQNKEEMSELFEGDTCEELARSATKTIPFVVVTDGPNGVVASDGKKIYRGGMYEDVPVVDRLGAGDAFSSGFVAMIAKGEGIEQAITFASANSTSVVGVIGAKPGILYEDAKLHSMPIEITDI